MPVLIFENATPCNYYYIGLAVMIRAIIFFDGCHLSNTVEDGYDTKLHAPHGRVESWNLYRSQAWQAEQLL